MGVFLFFAFGFCLFVAINKLWCFWCNSKVCLVGKTAIVTGAASGIGFQTALALASKGCRIIIADINNISQAVEEMKKLSHNPQIIGKKIDLQSFKSVRTFAKDIIDTEQQLHLLVCNAGIGDFRLLSTTEDGLERTMQINYFSHFLLTHLLLDLLKKSAPSRITFTSSLVAYVSDLTIDTLNPGPEYYQRWYRKYNGGVYSNSKLAMAAAAKLFGEKLQGSGVIANAVHPGGVKTPIFIKAVRHDGNFFAGYSFIGLVYLYGKTPEEGAQSLIHIAHSDEVRDVTGQSFIEGKRFPRPFQLTDKFCNALWEASIRFTRLASHEIGC